LSRITISHKSALTRARVTAFRALLRQRGEIELCGGGYRTLRRQGFSRADVTRAVEALFQSGEAVIVILSSGAVVVRLAGQESKQVAL
jgi:hypothetical protein